MNKIIFIILLLVLLLFSVISCDNSTPRVMKNSMSNIKDEIKVEENNKIQATYREANSIDVNLISNVLYIINDFLNLSDEEKSLIPRYVINAESEKTINFENCNLNFSATKDHDNINSTLFGSVKVNIINREMGKTINFSINLNENTIINGEHHSVISNIEIHYNVDDEIDSYNVNYRHPKGLQLPGFVENCFQHY